MLSNYHALENFKPSTFFQQLQANYASIPMFSKLPMVANLVEQYWHWHIVAK